MSGSREWFTTYVEQCLGTVLEVEELEVDCGDDYAFRWGAAQGLVRVEDEPLLLRVVAVAVHGVRRSAKLLAELNELNANSRAAHAYWRDGMVFVEHVVLAEGVDVATLEYAIRAVGSVADDIGVLLAALFGGATPLSASRAAIDEDCAG